MSKSLIRKNQLHPDIADLVSGYGDSFFTTPFEAQNLVDNSFNSTVRITGNQTIDGVKSFSSKPFFNGIELATVEDVSSSVSGEYVFPSNLTVTLSNGKTFGKYGNGDTIEAAGKTLPEILQLVISETIPPTIYLNTTPTEILLGQINISNVLNRSYTINNPGALISSASLKWRRGGVGNWTVLTTSTSNNSSYLHTFTNINNSNSIDYEYTVIDLQNTTGTAYASALFLYGNYFGYSSATSLTTVAQIEALGNQMLSDGRSRTVSNITAGSGQYTYYAYKSTAGDLTSIIQDGTASVLGAFTKQSDDILGANLNGVSVTYRVYRSNAPQAFTNNTLVFS